jgi:hypothetical protein
LLAVWQPRLGLTHWGDIPLYVRNFKDTTAAEIRWTKGYKGAAVSFSKKWIEAPERTYADFETTLVHELIHLIFAEFDDAIETGLGFGSVYDSYCEKREGLCDVFASLFIARYARAKKVKR